MRDWHEMRARVFALVGNRCAKCGFDDPRALQLDHRNGGGWQARRNGGTWGILVHALEHPEEYQILCANHNWIKRAERGEQGGRPRTRPVMPSSSDRPDSAAPQRRRGYFQNVPEWPVFKSSYWARRTKAVA